MREERAYLAGETFQSTKSEKRRKRSLMEYFESTRAFDLQMLTEQRIGTTPMYLLPLSREADKLNKQVKSIGELLPPRLAS